MVVEPVDGDTTAVDIDAIARATEPSPSSMAAADGHARTADATAVLHGNDDNDWLAQVLDRNMAAADRMRHDDDTTTIGNVAPGTNKAETTTVGGNGSSGTATETLVGNSMSLKEAVEPEIMGGDETMSPGIVSDKGLDMDNSSPAHDPPTVSAVAWEEEVAMISAERMPNSLSLDNAIWDSLPPTSHDTVPTTTQAPFSHAGNKKWACLAIGLLTIVIAAALVGGFCGGERCLPVSSAATTTPTSSSGPASKDPTTGFRVFTST
jgi:hypothetical protein